MTSSGRSLSTGLRAFLVGVLVLACASVSRAQQEEPTAPRHGAPLTILQINDVYSTIPVDGLGGLARVAELKRQLVDAGRTPLLVMAGDFLSPSVPSAIFKGEQMLAALNAAGLDLATLGNHEFDFGPDVLRQRMAEAKWQWVVSNVLDLRTNAPVGGAAPYLVRSFGGLKVGFLGLCLNTEEITEDNMRGLRIVDPIEAAATYLPVLKREGAEVIVLITHLAYPTDRELARRFPEVDVIVGGHEHYPLTSMENRTLISKAGSDAKFVARIDINRGSDGVVERYFELVPITAAIPDHPATARVVGEYEARLGTELNVVVGRTEAGLDANAVRLRSSETNLGNLVADALRADVGADIAIVNSGSIRGDRVYPAGPLTRRTIIEIQPFGNVVCKIAVAGRIVLDALNAGVALMPRSEGRFPQVSGLTMTVDLKAPVGSRVQNVRVNGQPLDPAKEYTVATTDYQLKGGDGYGMFSDQRVLVGPEAGPLAAASVGKYVAARGTVNPQVEGRITIEP